MKKLLPLVLILCTVLVLALNVFAGSQGGQRIAVVQKAAANAIDMTKTDKDAAFEDAAMYEIKYGTTASAKIYTAWDATGLYFYADISDTQLTKFIQKHAAAAGKTDKEAASDYRSKVSTSLTQSTLACWGLPAFEICVDPTNEAPAGQANNFTKQARITFDGWKMSYIPGEDSGKSYNEYDENAAPADKRYTAVVDTMYDADDKAIGYKIKMHFSNVALGLTNGFKDWDAVSVHAFFYAATADGGIASCWSDFDNQHMVSDNWKGTHYSWYRLWDPAVSSAKTREDAEKITESTKATTTTTTRDMSQTFAFVTTTTKATTTTTANAAAPGTTEAPKDEGGCGSMIGAGTAILMVAMAAAPVVLLKKKKED